MFVEKVVNAENMLIAYTLTLVLASAAASVKYCSTKEDCKLYCPQVLKKCVGECCSTDYDCGANFFCSEMPHVSWSDDKFCTLKRVTCNPSNGPADCERFLQCDNGKCIAEIPECFDDPDCNHLQHCVGGYCKM